MVKTEDFFIEQNRVTDIPNYDTDVIAALIQSVEAFARVAYQSVYLIDYYKQEFLYVADNPLFLCGHTAQEVKEMGYGFYLQHVSEEEQKMLIDINTDGFKLFENFDRTEKHQCSISYDFHLCQGKQKTLINHKLTPVLLTEDGHIWIAMCIVSLSSHITAGHVEFYKDGQPNHWQYSFESHKWKTQSAVVLKQEEREVLRLSAAGLTMNEIADKMCKSVDSIKFYKRNTFEKLNVSNITEALSRAVTYKLF